MNSAGLTELRTSRTEAILDLVEQTRDGEEDPHIVFFSEFRRFLDILERVMKEDRPELKVYRYDGRLRPTERDKTRKAWAADPGAILLCTRQSAGLGIDLTTAHNCIQTEPWWVAADQNQAHSRVFRTGQVDSVSVWVLSASNSEIEMHILRRRDEKGAVSQKIYELVRTNEQSGVYSAPELPDLTWPEDSALQKAVLQTVKELEDDQQPSKYNKKQQMIKRREYMIARNPVSIEARSSFR